MSDAEFDDAELDDVASELYAHDPAEFVTARKTAAAAAKDAGNRALATAIGKLRKPTTVGWMVNLLVRHEPEDIADLFDLGDRLRDAQRRSSTGDLRELSSDRQKSIRALTARAVDIAREHGRSATDDAAREVGQTLGAALADPEVAERVRGGRVVTAESYSGFGPAVLALAPDPDASRPDASRPGVSEPDASEEDPRDAEALAEAERDLDDARQDEDAAREQAESAAASAEEAAARLSEIKQKLTSLRAELHETEALEADARKNEKSSERESRRLRRILTDAQARTAELEKTTKKLRS
ncbi:hypothetical protein [Rhodococcus sp. P1Y]|uniref:hypothetical protein n=1 Tax=Rhodococcus sp. P1Y TaxID=1302308 RepID=UPI000EB5ADFC|nr:hypothetical protein [Rhodococcus sp. P1Y]AYJ50661.1 hypothetical protein D8W71_22935 [Rhodococcus sp. P1Y]